MGDVAVRCVLNRSDDEAFFDVQATLMTDVEVWRPQPASWERKLFDADRSAYMRHRECERYLAERDDQIVGRVVAWVDDRADDVGWFGFFDAVDDVETIRSLLWAASDWCRSRGCVRVRGPVDFTALLSAGVIVEGFERPDYIGLHYSPPYVAEHVEALGFEAVVDLWGWTAGTETSPPARDICRAVFSADDVEVEPFDTRTDAHWNAAHTIYTSSYVDGELYLPLEPAELRLAAEGFVEPNLSSVVRVGGEVAAVSIALTNVVETAVRVGRIVPPDTVQRIVRRGRPPRSWRGWLFGVVPKFRGRAVGGLGTALYVRTAEAGLAIGSGELTWTRSSDERLNAGLVALGARHDRTHRLYERAFAPAKVDP